MYKKYIYFLQILLKVIEIMYFGLFIVFLKFSNLKHQIYLGF